MSAAAPGSACGNRVWGVFGCVAAHRLRCQLRCSCMAAKQTWSPGSPCGLPRHASQCLSLHAQLSQRNPTSFSQTHISSAPQCAGPGQWLWSRLLCGGRVCGGARQRDRRGHDPSAAGGGSQARRAVLHPGTASMSQVCIGCRCCVHQMLHLVVVQSKVALDCNSPQPSPLRGTLASTTGAGLRHAQPVLCGGAD